MGGFDFFVHIGTQFGLIQRISRVIDTFGHILKFRISTGELSQLFCRIHLTFKVLVVVVVVVETIFEKFELPFVSNRCQRRSTQLNIRKFIAHRLSHPKHTFQSFPINSSKPAMFAFPHVSQLNNCIQHFSFYR